MRQVLFSLKKKALTLCIGILKNSCTYQNENENCIWSMDHVVK